MAERLRDCTCGLSKALFPYFHDDGDGDDDAVCCTGYIHPRRSS